MLISIMNKDLFLLSMSVLVLHILLVSFYLSQRVQQFMPKVVYMMNHVTMVVVFSNLISFY